MAEAGITRDFLGLNKGKPDTNLAPNEAAYCRGVWFNEQRIEKRLGSQRLSPWVIPKPSANFDGESYRQSPSISWAVYNGLDYRLNAFTMEIAGKFPATNSTTTHCLAQRAYSESGGTLGWTLEFNTDDRTFEFYSKMDAGADIDVTGTWTNYAPSKPFHLAIRRTAATCYLWLKDNEFEGIIGQQAGITDAAKEATQASAYPICFGTGVDIADTSAPVNFAGQLQEFRTWDYERSTETVQAFALKELPPYATATNSLKFYYKLNEGTGQPAYDYGYISRVGYSTMTNAFAAFFAPSPPTWVDGLVSGGLGDKALELDGTDDFCGWVLGEDTLSALRTGTVDWTVQFNTKPLDEVQDDAVFLMYGDTAYATGSNGFAFRVRASVDKTVPESKFVAEWCFATETAAVTWGTSFTSSVTYGLTLQRLQGEVRFRVDDLTNGTAGTFQTAGVTSPGAPQFPETIAMVSGASYPATGAIPTTGFCHCVVDELRVFQGIRWESQNVHYPNGSDPNLLGYWKFNEGQGNILNDSGPNRKRGYVFPYGEKIPWVGGFVKPVEGPPVTGLFYYQRNNLFTSMSDSRERAFLVCAGNSIYRNEGDRWSEIESGKNYDSLYTGAQLGNQLVLCNGVDNNRLYDGDYMWADGIAAPTEPATQSLSALASGFWDTHTSGNTVAMGLNGYTCIDSDRTEQGYSFNGIRVLHDLGATTGTIETRVEKYFKDRSFSPLSVQASATHSWIFVIWHPDFTTSGTYPVKQYGMEGASLGIWTPTGGTQTVIIQRDEAVDSKSGFRTVWTWDSVTGFVGLPQPGYAHTLRLKGHFIWQSAATDTIYSTSSYSISPYEAGVIGNFYYRYTNYNRYTGIESNPSPPTDSVASPNLQAVSVTVDTTTNTSVTDRLIYRTYRDGARTGGDYFLLGTATGTGQVTYFDVTVDGEQGRLISFYRDVPPKAAICRAFKGRMWYVPVNEPNYLYFSEVYRPAEIDPYNYMIFGDDSDHITALGVWEDSLVVWKRRSTWIIPRADNPIGVTPIRINDSVGCVSHHSVVEANGENIFLGEDGVYSQRGSEIRRVSSDKVQFFIRRLDPNRLHKAVASNLRQQGIYRLNVSPYSLYATTVRSDVNSWALEYHYQRSRDHVPFYEPIWGYDEREVSFYGQYVSEDNLSYNAYGDYRGFVYLDNIQNSYTDGLGWYRGSAVWSTTTSPDAAISTATYTLSVNGDMMTDGDGLKGLPIYIRGASGYETHVCYENTADKIALQTPTAASYATSVNVFVAPIISRYKSGWLDFGSTLRDKSVKWLKVDYAELSSKSTMTVGIYGGRGTTIANQTVQTHTIHMDEVNEKLEARIRGKHVQVEFQHDWPGERFEIYGWEFSLDPERDR